MVARPALEPAGYAITEPVIEPAMKLRAERVAVRCLSVAVCRRGLLHLRLPLFIRSAPASGDMIEAYVTPIFLHPPRAVSTSSITGVSFPLRAWLTGPCAAHNCQRLSVLWEGLLSAMAATAAGLWRRRCSAPARARRALSSRPGLVGH